MIDVADPAAPRELGSCPTPGAARGVQVAGRYAYVADDWGGLRVIDVSEPAAPREVAAFDTPGQAAAVWVSGDHVYVADGTGGLFDLWQTTSTYSVIPPTGGSLASKSDSTTYDFADGTFAAAAIVTHRPLAVGNLPPTGGLVASGHAFEVTAVYQGSSQAAQPARPDRLQVCYQVGRGTAVERTWALYSWDGVGWTREPSSQVDVANHWPAGATARRCPARR